MTITIQIGNSDDKLTQIEWSNYVSEIQDMLVDSGTKIHFFGGSTTWSPWQNVAWVIDTNEAQEIAAAVGQIRKKYNQDSVAWTEGSTLFI